MFATMRIYKLSPQNAGIFLDHSRQGLAGLLRKMPGFIAYYEIDQGDGVIATFTIFQNEAAEDRPSQLVEDWENQHRPSIIPDRPQIVKGQVALYEGKSEGPTMSASR